MLETLNKFKGKNFDVIYFVSGDKRGSLDVYGNYYGDEVEKLKETELGNNFHIILFKEDDKGELYNTDMFEAILTDPLEYISQLIPSGWLGVILKKTTTSNTITQILFDKLTEK